MPFPRVATILVIVVGVARCTWNPAFHLLPELQQPMVMHLVLGCGNTPVVRRRLRLIVHCFPQ
eukprot:10673297-Prorocentrum_lima.AAC.1